MNKRNNKLKKYIDKLNNTIDYNNSQNLNKQSHLKLISMKWDWLLCYKNNCWFDFEKMDNSINYINAKNGFGKSSFIEIICLSLFGESIPSRKNDSLSSSIINNKKPNGKISFVQIFFIYNNIKYSIHREFYNKKNTIDIDETNNNKLQQKNVKLFIINDNENNLFIEGTQNVDKWISNNIGNIDGFLLSCIYTQEHNINFFSLKNDDQIEFIENSLKITEINNFLKLLKHKILFHDHIYKELEILFKNKNNILLFHNNDEIINKTNEINNIIEEKKNIKKEIKINYNIIKNNLDDLELYNEKTILIEQIDIINHNINDLYCSLNDKMNYYIKLSEITKIINSNNNYIIDDEFNCDILNLDKQIIIKFIDENKCHNFNIDFNIDETILKLNELSVVNKPNIIDNLYYENYEINLINNQNIIISQIIQIDKFLSIKSQDYINNINKNKYCILDIDMLTNLLNNDNINMSNFNDDIINNNIETLKLQIDLNEYKIKLDEIKLYLDKFNILSDINDINKIDNILLEIDINNNIENREKKLNDELNLIDNEFIFVDNNELQNKIYDFEIEIKNINIQTK